MNRRNSFNSNQNRRGSQSTPAFFGEVPWQPQQMQWQPQQMQWRPQQMQWQPQQVPRSPQQMQYPQPWQTTNRKPPSRRGSFSAPPCADNKVQTGNVTDGDVVDGNVSEGNMSDGRSMRKSDPKSVAISTRRFYTKTGTYSMLPPGDILDLKASARQVMGQALHPDLLTRQLEIMEFRDEGNNTNDMPVTRNPESKNQAKRTRDLLLARVADLERLLTLALAEIRD